MTEWKKTRLKILIILVSVRLIVTQLLNFAVVYQESTTAAF